MKQNVISLKRDLFQSSGFLALAIMVCFSLLFAGVYHASEMVRARAVLRHANRSAQLFVTGVFREIIHTLSALEADPEIRNAAALNPEARDRVLTKYQAFARANEAIEFVYSGYSDGSMMIDPEVWEMPEGFDPTVRPWYTAAMRSAPAISVGVPYQEYTSREWMVSTSQALKLSDGVYGGVIAIDYAIGDMVAVFNQYTDYTTGRCFVIDTEGLILLHRDESLLGAPAANILEAMAGAEQGTFTYRADDGTRLAHFSPVPLTGWTVVTDVSRNEIVLPILQRILAASGLAGIIAVALVLSQSIYLSRRFIRPLTALDKGLRTIIAGDAGLDEAVYPNNEIGVIAKKIGQLAAGEMGKKTAALHKSHEHLAATLRSIGDGVITCDHEGRMTSLNRAAETLTGWTTAEAAGRTIEEVFRIINAKTRETAGNPVTRALAEGVIVGLANHTVLMAKDGTEHPIADSCAPIRDASGTVTGAVLVFRDVTEEEKQEQFRELSREVLRILNEPGDVQESIQRVLAALKTHTGFDAVGIRLQHEEDFPYLAQDGFSADFLLTENSLIERDAQGGICRDADGAPSLECTCGLVLSGKTDPSNPLFTPGGSAWTNDSFPILEVPADQDPRHHPRNQCIHQGYASIALIPIRTDRQIVGLLQLNARRKDCFSLAHMGRMEGLAAHIGSALQRKQIEQSLSESEIRFKALFVESPVSILIHDKDTGEVVDANQAAWKAYGYTSLEALKAADFFSDTPYSVREALAWIHKAVTEGEQQFEWRSRKANGELFWEQVFLRKVMLAQVERVLATTIDITQRKRIEAELKKHIDQLTRINKLMMGREMRVLELKKEINALRKQTGQAPIYTAVEGKE